MPVLLQTFQSWTMELALNLNTACGITRSQWVNSLPVLWGCAADWTWYPRWCYVAGCPQSLTPRRCPGRCSWRIWRSRCHCGPAREINNTPRFNIKTVFPGIGIPIMTIRWSWDHHHYPGNGDSYIVKTASLYWDGPQAPFQCKDSLSRYIKDSHNNEILHRWCLGMDK